MKKHIEVVAGIIEYENQILCMQRSRGKYDYVSLKWEFPGGKIEQGETNEQALARELQEEMEMKVDILSYYDEVSYDYPDFSLTMYCYLCKAHDQKFVMNVHNDFRWMTLDKIDSLDWAPADVSIVKDLKDRGV